ncbi:tetratricopeptide repeat protein [Flavobacterium sp.]|uniref:tetratricopeptide repeat-containing sensor histidine kinase n=1 Tax=Flavobacterium sp. TaxID=239 RepID=UPI0035296FB9
MKKLYLIFFLCSCGFTFVFSQNKTADSLKNVLYQTKNDIEKVQLLNEIADYYKSSNPVLMEDYATKALTLAKKIDFKAEEATALLNLGIVSIISGDYPKALDFFSQAKVVFENELAINVKDNHKLKNGLAKVYGSMGVVFSEQSNYANALQYNLKAVSIYEETKEVEKLARVYNNIGVVFRAQSEDFKALDYFTKAQKIQEKNGDRTVGITTTNIGNLHVKQKNYNQALHYYTKALRLFEKYPDARGLGELHNNLGLYYKAINEPNKAMESWNLAIASFDSIGDKFGKSDTYLHIGEFLFEQNRFQEALPNAQKAVELSRDLNVLEGIALAEKLLSSIYEKSNQPLESLQHFKLYKAAQDSLINHENIRKSVQAEMNFAFEKKEALHKKELEKKEVLIAEKAKRQTLQLFFVGLFVLLLSGIAFLIYNRIQLKKTLTLQKELAEYEQKALHLQMNPHFVFNCLGSISSFIVQNGTDSAIKYLSKFSKLMRLTLEYSKESLIPIDKEIESLQNYLELEQLRFNNVFSFDISKSKDIEDDMAIPPLLLQPFVENAIIHGLIPKKENGQIHISFSIQNENLICTIQDNGIGIEKSKELKEHLVSIHKSMALDITKKRLEMMEAATAQKANVEIKEIKNELGEIQGTKVVLKLPIQYIK